MTRSVRLVALLLQHEAAMTSFGGTMAHLTHFGLLHNGGKSSLKEHSNLTLFDMGFERRKNSFQNMKRDMYKFFVSGMLRLSGK